MKESQPPHFASQNSPQEKGASFLMVLNHAFSMLIETQLFHS